MSSSSWRRRRRRRRRAPCHTSSLLPLSPPACQYPCLRADAQQQPHRAQARADQQQLCRPPPAYSRLHRQQRRQRSSMVPPAPCSTVRRLAARPSVSGWRRRQSLHHQAGAATVPTVGGSVHTTAAAAAVHRSGASTVIRAAAVMYPQKCLPPSHQQAVAPRGPSPPNRKQHPAQPAGQALQVSAGETHLHPAPSCYMPVYRSCCHACTRPMALHCQK